VLVYGIVVAQIAFALVILTNVLWLGRLAGQVSTQQPDLYDQLGGHPLIPMRGVIRAQLRWLTFLYSGRYRTELIDPALRISAKRFLGWFTVTTLPLVVAITLCLVVIVTSGLRAA